MKELIEAGFDLQLLLFAGYVALTISDIGTGKTRSAAVMAFRVFGFGLFVSIVWSVAKSLILLVFPTANGWFGQNYQDPIKAIIFILMAGAIGAIWLNFGRRCFYWFLRNARVSGDNGAPSAIQTLMSMRVPWHFVRLHMKDGAKFTCTLTQLPEQTELVTQPVTIDIDGVLMHVTQAKKVADEAETPRDVTYGNERSLIQYFPMTSIDWIEVGWRRKKLRVQKRQKPAVQSLEGGGASLSDGASSRSG